MFYASKIAKDLNQAQRFDEYRNCETQTHKKSRIYIAYLSTLYNRLSDAITCFGCPIKLIEIGCPLLYKDRLIHFFLYLRNANK